MQGILKTKFCLLVLAIFLSTAGPVHPDCDKCSDLCRLMDQYLQREKGIELWRKYAASTPDEEKGWFYSDMTDTEGIENAVWDEFNHWSKRRVRDGQLPCKPIGGGGGPSTDLVTLTNNDKCEIMRVFGEGTPQKRYEKLEGQTLTDFEKDVGCKALSDATIEHEKVHQRHCQNAYRQDPAGGGKFLDRAEVVAESEYQAWNHQKQLIEDAIRRIVREQGCGWDPTERQKNDPNAIPSLKQVQDMENRGWKAVNALSSTYEN